MTHSSVSSGFLLLVLGGCGLMVDLPEARVEETAGTGGASTDEHDDGQAGAPGSAVGSQAGDGDAPSEGDGDGTLPEAATGGGEATGGNGWGGAPAETGGAENGGTSTGGKPESGGASSGGMTGCAAPCDCDADGALSDSPTCGGSDCDDSDARVFPTQTQFFSEPANDVVGFDYNCDGNIERPVGQSDPIDCAAIALGNCSATQGFDAVPPCGQRGDWGECVPETLNCSFSVIEANRVVQCR